MSHPSVIVAGARTPFGRFRGAVADLTAAELGGAAIKAAIVRSGIEPAWVDHLLMGQVLQAGCGQNPARSAGRLAGLPSDVPCSTVNKVCLSGLVTITDADRMIRAGDADVVVAGGMESMSNAPHLLPRSAAGLPIGDARLIDSLAYDGLHDQETDQTMGSLTESWYGSRPELPREEQDAFAVRSHQQASRAQQSGILQDEITPLTIAGAKATTIEHDEGIRHDTSLERLSGLRPAFGPNGSITAGNASQISDGAAAVVVMSKAVAEQRGIQWLAEIRSSGSVAGPDSTLQLQPADATRRALDRAGLAVADLDVAEFNEAFAAVAIESRLALGLPESALNPNGGAIALGHPLGASGTRIVLHLALELNRRGGGTGVAALCGGGGQGDALILQRPTA